MVVYRERMAGSLRRRSMDGCWSKENRDCGCALCGWTSWEGDAMGETVNAPVKIEGSLAASMGHSD